MENEVWALWSSMRIGIAISSIFIIVAVWVGARFTSVMVDKKCQLYQDLFKRFLAYH